MQASNDILSQGLTTQQVEASRREHGANVLTPPKRRSLWSQFLDKFNDPLIKILLVALALSLGIAGYEFFKYDEGMAVLLEPAGIFVAIVLATLVGFLVEVNANKKFDILNQTNDDILVKVVRNGSITTVSRCDIVVGDIAILETGEKVPADGILLSSMQMSVNESSLTGEPLAHKSHREEDVKANTQSTYPMNEVMRGSTVVEGHGVIQVTRVGDNTEYGKVFTDAQIDNNLETPLMKQFDRLGRVIAVGSYVIAGLIILGRATVFFLNGVPDDNLEIVHYVVQTIMLAVSLIVVSVPEGLPMSVTLSLALSMRRMLRSNNLVRKMHACETMGAATIICTDKTGTLTKNQMQVVHTHFYGLDHQDLGNDEQSNIISESIACNSTAFIDNTQGKALGNPTEGALLLWLKDQGRDYMVLRKESQLMAQLPFSTERKYMATIVSSKLSGKTLLLVKGASEIIWKYCSGVAATQCDRSEKLPAFIADELLSFQRRAMRTLGFAYCELPDGFEASATIDLTTLPPLTFLGIVAISDPVREEIPFAIKDCRQAGIDVKIVTGDTPDTAREVGRQAGLWSDDDDTTGEAILTGPEWQALSDEEALERAHKLKILARARPDDKARLVNLLQSDGEVVAVTGDGTNDAPALNAAQVGLSMGDGTSVAKEASDITIMDNSFGSISKAVLWGRSLYRNIQRFIIFQLTVNVCACLVVAIGSFMSITPALTVTQMLWVNLIMDTFAALALASLPPNSRVMRDRPRRDTDSIISKSMAMFILGTGILFALIMLGGLYYLLHLHNDGQSHIYSMVLEPGEVSVYFTTFVFLQFWNMFNARSFGSGHSAFHNVKDSKLFFTTAAVIFFGQIFIVECCGDLFACQPMTPKQWVAIVLGTMPVLLVGEIYHHYRR
ncbi:MAG: calcium-translocating P-type ATPase, PMCA-type [Muribaculaceae bacterium]|nr:calcium-translocating P-type ATPase, PMCA-type [Muribaculaceae bacterium]